MGDKILSICKEGVRYDIAIKIEKVWTEEARRASAEARAKLKGMNDQQLIDHVKNKENTKDNGYFAHAKEEIASRGLQHKFPEHFPAHSYIKVQKQEPIASDKPVISQGAIVTLNGHKGKVLQTEGDFATVSWEDAALSKVPIKDLKYEGRVEKCDDHRKYQVGKGGAGSGRFSDDLNSVQLHVARHLRRQGILTRKKK